jgi:hypothetical protein
MPAGDARSRRSVLGLLLPLVALGLEETLAAKKKKKGKGKGKKKSACPSGDVNCDEFATQAEAQRFYEKCGGPATDRYGLDTDHDGIACEHQP